VRLKWPDILKHDATGKAQPLWVRAVVVSVWALCASQVLWTARRFLVEDLWRPDPGADILVMAALAAGCALALASRKRAAAELAGWAALSEVVLVDWTQGARLWSRVPEAVGWLLAAVLLLLAGKRIFVRKAPRVRNTLGDLAGALRATLALFLVLDLAAAAWIHGNNPRAMITTEPPPTMTTVQVEGLPTVATLGSSPANYERDFQKPFSLILAHRFQGRLNFVSSGEGGVNSDKLVAMARRLVDSDQRPDGFLVYAGHEDFDDYAGLKFLVDLDPVGRSEATRAAVAWVLRHSALVRLSLFHLWMWNFDFFAAPAGERARAVFPHMRDNLEAILELAADHGIRVFVVTLHADWSLTPLGHREYVGLLNDWYRSLLARYPHVSLVDFEQAARTRYPDGPLADCEPFETPLPGRDGCTNAFHMSSVGHTLIADLVEPVLDHWVESRQSP